MKNLKENKTEINWSLKKSFYPNLLRKLSKLQNLFLAIKSLQIRRIALISNYANACGFLGPVPTYKPVVGSSGTAGRITPFGAIIEIGAWLISEVGTRVYPVN